MGNKLFILSISILLSACATDGPVIKTVVQKVEIPISVPCKTIIPTQPSFSFDQLMVNQDIFDKTRVLLADRELHLGYEAELLAALKSCK